MYIKPLNNYLTALLIKQILDEFHPESVLDAGASLARMGFFNRNNLLEALVAESMTLNVIDFCIEESMKIDALLPLDVRLFPCQKAFYHEVLYENQPSAHLYSLALAIDCFQASALPEILTTISFYLSSSDLLLLDLFYIQQHTQYLHSFLDSLGKHITPITGIDHRPIWLIH